ncbi:MAG: gliding motility-associated C-terminal domain-containing protein [Bacteroidia bacterium]|nr:gliding motility-associated C-terminal domain-containing protein [Bacteroidia bacterium]
MQEITQDTTISHTYPPGHYTLTVIGSVGECRDTLTIEVVILGERQLVIPTAFTPNNDGINDVWTPQGTGIQRLEMRIYDRWGKLLYQGEGPWRGENALEGVYTFVVRVTFIDGSSTERAGTVTLLR